MVNNWIWNPKLIGSGIIECIPQKGRCPNKCPDCFFQSGRSYLEPLDKNLPHIPSMKMALGRIVRINDGNDSNNERDLVEQVAKRYDDYFFNTSQPYLLNNYSGPVVWTVNPGDSTDTDFVRLVHIPNNVMFVRVRVNAWNIKNVVDKAVHYYTSAMVPVVLTFMAYYTTPIPKRYEKWYDWKIRNINSYWVLKPKYWHKIANRYKDNDLVYTCGRSPNNHSCRYCGHCVREYYVTKERMNGVWSR